MNNIKIIRHKASEYHVTKQISQSGHEVTIRLRCLLDHKAESFKIWAFDEKRQSWTENLESQAVNLISAERYEMNHLINAARDLQRRCMAGKGWK